MENGALRLRPCCLLSTSLRSNCSIGSPRGIQAYRGPYPRRRDVPGDGRCGADGPSSVRSWSSLRPSTSTSLSRDVAPRTMLRLVRGRSRWRASKRMTASLARPFSGRDRTLSRSDCPCQPAIRSSLAPGVTCSLRRAIRNAPIEGFCYYSGAMPNTPERPPDAHEKLRGLER